MNAPAATAPIEADFVVRRLDEMRPLASTARVATLWILLLALWSEGGTQGWALALVVVALLWTSFKL